MVNKVVIFLTSAIDVKGVGNTVISNTHDRYREYKSSFELWIENPSVQNIVFCDNSGFDLSEFENIAANSSKTVEVLSYFGQGFPRLLGKGYGEICAFEYAVKNSELFTEADYVIKVNGRYYLRNISAIVQQLKYGNTMVLGSFRHNLTWFDSRVFAFSPSFVINYLLKYKNKINDEKGYYFEHALACATHEAMAQGHEWEMFSVTPAIEGKSGSNGRVYSVYGFRWIVKEIYQIALRRLLKL